MIGEFNKDQNALPFVAASNIEPYSTVQLDTAADRQVVLASAASVEPHGLVGPATALQGEAVTVYGEGAVVEAVAAASLGAGANVGVGSTNGHLGPVASGSVRVGKSLEAAGAGEKFSVLLNPGDRAI